MKTGGNESATKYFQSHGGSAALASKDPKTKYTSNAATKYKDELQRRVEADIKKHPEEVTVEDTDGAASTGANTPAADDEDDFFSSWDKPAVKRPSNPPSRTGTPGINRTSSPFLNANGNGTARSKSPLGATEGSDAAAPSTVRTTSSSAIRRPAGTTKPKANILGAKKSKLGAKKVDAGALDFDEAEKKAREEAERKEKLGYDPNEETPSETQITAAQPDSSTTTIHQPTPMSPGSAGGFAQAGKGQEKSSADVDKLGMGVRKLGFGQVGGGAGAAAAKAGPPRMGFGSTSKPAQGTPRPPTLAFTSINTNALLIDDSERYARDKFGSQKGIGSDEFFGKGAFDPSAQSEAKNRLQGFEGAQSISSNAYFGRPEDENNDAEYGDLEGAAKDFVRKFGITAGDDIENLSNLVGEGATKLQGAIRDYLNS